MLFYIAHTHCKCDRLWVQFPPEEMNYLISHNLVQGKARCCVRHSIRNASRIRRKVGNGNILMGTKCFDTEFLHFLKLLKIKI